MTAASDATKVKEALNSLRDLTKCTCHEAYSGRGLEDPNCLHHVYSEDVEVLAARIDALEGAIACPGGLAHEGCALMPSQNSN